MCESILKRWLLEAANSPCWCDVTIFAGGQRYRAHRIVLSSASPFIRRLLLSRPSEDVPMTLVLADVSADTVEALLQYIYNGEVTLLPDQLHEFLDLSEQLLVYIDKDDINRMRAMTFDIASENINKVPVNLSMDINEKYYQPKSKNVIMNPSTQRFKNNLSLDELSCFSKYLAQEVYRLDAESNEKNLDLEIFIKSDKISKKSSKSLPITPMNNLNITSSDILNYEKIKSSILKSALGHKNMIEKTLSDLNQLNIDKTPAYSRNNKKIHTDTSSYTTHSLQREYLTKFCSTIPFLAPIIAEKLGNASYKEERNDMIDSEVFSDSSCEILEDANENNKKEPLTNKSMLSLSENKYHDHEMNFNGRFNTSMESVRSGRIQESEIVNLSYDINEYTPPPSIVNTRLNDHSNFTVSNNQSLLHSNQFRQNKHGDDYFHRNEKLIRPIPSLMPIETFSSILDLTPDKRRTKSFYKNVDGKNKMFTRNSNSAFDSVQNCVFKTRAVSQTSKTNDAKELASFQNNLNGRDSLRCGFRSTITDKVLQDSSLINANLSYNHNSYYNDSTHLMKDTPAQENIVRVKKKILFNKVLECPWRMRGPVLYCHSNVSHANFNKDGNKNEKIFYQELKDSTHGSNQSSESTLEKLKTNSHVKEICNDSNNNFPEAKEIENNYKINEIKTHIENVTNRLELLKCKQYKENDNQELKNILERNTINSECPKKISTESYASTFTAIKDDVSESGNAEQFECISQLPAPGALALKSSPKCEVCTKVFTSASALELHLASHSSRARYRCEQCDKCFSQLRNYKYHVSVHKGTKEFAATCNVCGKYFNDRGYLSSHMKIHRNRKEYQCPHCPKSFNQRVAYNMHVRIHTGVKPHQCEACGKAFSRKMLLKQHARTHSGEKPYACAACGKRFADRSNMTLHMRLHSGIKPFSCTLCPKSFTKKHHLKTHLNYHTGNKPYACEKCGLTFSQSSNMRTHMKKCSSMMPP